MNRQMIESTNNSGALLGEDAASYHVRLFNGAEVWCPKSDQSVTPCLIRDFYWESWITSWFLREIESSENFIDIGANSGYYSALARQEGLSVFAFEPNLSYIPLLDKLDVMVYPLALSDEAGKAILHIPGDLEGSATLRTDFKLTDYKVTSVEVDVSTLADVFPEPLIGKTLVKVDAEGMEEHIMRGAGNMQAVWMLEYTPGAYEKNFLSNLTKDFSLSWIDFQGGEQPISPADIIGFGDWLMLVLRPKA